MKIDEITRISLLYDFYGQLLTKRQQEVMELYHEENLSLSEIAEEFDISRQGVYDALKNGEKSLLDYEDKLGLVMKFQQSRDAVNKIDSIIDSVINRLEKGRADAVDGLAGNTTKDTIENTVKGSVENTVKNLKEVKAIIDKLED